MRKHIQLFIGMLFFTSVVDVGDVSAQVKTNKAIPRNKAAANIEDSIMDEILYLPEVRKRDDYVKKQTKNKRQLQVAIMGRPTKKDNNYLVEVLEDNGGSYYTHFSFFVNPKTLAIKYLDTANDTVLTLNEWREQQKAVK